MLSIRIVSYHFDKGMEFMVIVSISSAQVGVDTCMNRSMVLYTQLVKAIGR